MEQNKHWLAGLAQIEGISCQEYKSIVRGDLKFDKVSSERLMANGASFLSGIVGNVVFLGEEGYPQFLQEIVDPPKYFFYEGPFERVNFELSISIVGTRAPSDYGRLLAKFFGNKLGKISISVISGMAFGIDKLSQIACMQTGSLSVGVLGEAIDVWKEKNKSLYEDFKDKLVLISEYPAGTNAQKFTFPQRNRIIAGLTNKTIIIEAAERSGALITADFANQYERAVFAVPHELFSQKGKGCNNLIKENKAEILTDIVDLFGRFFFQQESSEIILPLDSGLQRILKIIKGNNLSVNEIADKLGANVGNLVPSLTKLETIGILTKSIDGRYKIS